MKDGVDFASLLKEEIQILKKFNHPNIVQVLDTGEQEDLPYYVMKWYPKTLKNFCQEHLKSLPTASQLSAKKYGMSERTALDIWRQVVSAFRDIREMGYIHADLNCNNIMIDDSNPSLLKPVLIDFGIAIQFSSEHIAALLLERKAHQSAVSEKGRTIWWSAPELQENYLTLIDMPRAIRENQSSGNRLLDLSKADIWSLGMVLYYLLYGQEPPNPIEENRQLELVTITPRLLNQLIDLLRDHLSGEERSRFMKDILPSDTQEQVVIDVVEKLDKQAKRRIYNALGSEQLRQDMVSLLMCYVTKHLPAKLLEFEKSKLSAFNADLHQRIAVIDKILKLKEKWWLNEEEKIELNSLIQSLRSTFSRYSENNHPIREVAQQITTEMESYFDSTKKANTFAIIKEAEAKLEKISKIEGPLKEETEKCKSQMATFEEKHRALMQKFEDDPIVQSLIRNDAEQDMNKEKVNFALLDKKKKTFIKLNRQLQLYMESTGSNLRFPQDRREEPVSNGLPNLLKLCLEYYLDKRIGWTELLAKEFIQLKGIWREQMYQDRALEREKSLKVIHQLLTLSRCPPAYIPLEAAEICRRLHYLLSKKNCLLFFFYQLKLVEERESGMASVIDESKHKTLFFKLAEVFEKCKQQYEAACEMVIDRGEECDPSKLQSGIQASSFGTPSKDLSLRTIKQEIRDTNLQLETALNQLKGYSDGITKRLTAYAESSELLPNLASSVQFISQTYHNTLDSCSAYLKEDEAMFADNPTKNSTF